MRRRVRKEEPHNKDRWLVSYADFITLLFAVFVVLYAVANINLEYYKELLQKSNIALDSDTTINKKIKSKSGKVPMKEQLAELTSKLEQRKEEYKQYLKGKKELNALNDKLEETLTQEIKQKAVIMHKHEDWLALELKSLFPSGSALPKDESFPILGKLADSLLETSNKISVQGYTDSVPIQNSIFPSNWELSAARAAAVVRVLVDFGVTPTQLSAIGYGELYPIGDNSTVEGRLRNRRIVILIALDSNLMNKLNDNLQPYLKPKTGDTMDPNVDVKKLKLKTGDKKLPAGLPTTPPVIESQ